MRIGFTLHNPHFAFWTIIGQAARERAAELDIEIVMRPVSAIPEQCVAIKRLIDERVDVLLVGPIESHGLADAVRAATDAGIPVVAVDTAIFGCDVSTLVQADNAAGMRLVARYVAEQLGGRGNIVHLQGPQAFQTAVLRRESAQQVFAQHPDITLVFEDAAETWFRDSGYQLMLKALRDSPVIHAVVAANDPLALGALDALAEVGNHDAILVTGFDAMPDALLAISKGNLAATIRQSPRAIGRAAVETALQIVQGVAVPAHVPIDVELITAENLLDAALETLHILPSALHDVAESSTALAKERNLLHTMIDALPNTYAFAKDRQSRYIIANAAHAAALGAHKVEDIVGKTDVDLLPEKIAAAYHAADEQVMRSGQPLLNQVQAEKDQHGGCKWTMTSKVPLFDDDGTVVGLVGMSQDITALKQAEEEHNRLSEEIIRIQAAALAELSTPLIPITDTVMVMPLIGSIDSRRAQQVLESLLQGVAAQHAQQVILDITGVPIVDTQVANVLIQAAQAVKLLGAQVILSGIRPEVAQTLVGLGVDLQSVITQGTLQMSIAYALRHQKEGKQR